MAQAPLKNWVEKLKSSSSDVARGLDEMHTLVRRDSAKAYSFYQQDGDPGVKLPPRDCRERSRSARPSSSAFYGS